jgi:hypothetical protein
MFTSAGQMLGDLAALDRDALACAVRRRTIEIKACRHAAFACSARADKLAPGHASEKASISPERRKRSIKSSGVSSIVQFYQCGIV